MADRFTEYVNDCAKDKNAFRPEYEPALQNEIAKELEHQRSLGILVRKGGR